MKIVQMWVCFCCVLCSSMVYADPLDVFANQKGSIDIAGGTAHLPVMQQAAKKIMKYNKAIKITVAGGGTGVGLKKVGEGLVDIGNSGRSLKDFEIEKYGLVSFPFAVDGVAIVVNPENTLKGLTKAQTQAIFSGEITNWESLGGACAPINVYCREDGSGTREVFENSALGNVAVTKKVSILNSNGAMKTAVAHDKNAIGYISIGHLDSSVKGLEFDGVSPTQKHVLHGVYSIKRFLYMNTKRQPQGITKLFIDYIYSSDGEKFIIQSGYIPIAKE